MDLKKYLTRAETALKRGQADLAIDFCDEVMDFAPGDAGAAGLLARAILANSKAGGFFGKLGASTAGLTAKLRRDPDAQARQLRAAFIKDPSKLSFGYRWAEALENAGYAGAALEVFGELSSQDGDSAKRASALAAAQGEIDRALEYLQVALDRNPRDTEAIRARKNLAAEQALLNKKYDEANSAQDVAYDPDAFLRAARGEDDSAGTEPA